MAAAKLPNGISAKRVTGSSAPDGRVNDRPGTNIGHAEDTSVDRRRALIEAFGPIPMMSANRGWSDGRKRDCDADAGSRNLIKLAAPHNIRHYWPYITLYMD